MESVIDILECLESDNSRIHKEDVLHRNRGNDLLRKIFVVVGDPYVNFFVKKWKTPQPTDSSVLADDDVMRSFIDTTLVDLSTRTIVGNEAKAAVETSFQAMNSRQQKWCTRILLRNLRVGVMETTVNKVWPGSIKKFSVQLAETLSSRHEPGKGIVLQDKVAYPVRVEPKLDGLRCIAVKRGGTVTMFTRNGTILETLPTIKAAIEAASWDDFVLDGEAMGADWNESASVVMSHKRGKDDRGIVYNVFDAMHFDDWSNQVNDSFLSDRIDLVKELVAGIGHSNVVPVEGVDAKDETELLKAYGDSMNSGYEGIMVKDLTASYSFKRTATVRKLKPVTTYEAVVVGHYEGRVGSKREGLWGGFEVLTHNGVTTRVGGGFTDKLKAEIGLDPNSWLGRVVEVEGQPDPSTTDGLTQDGRIRFPVFVRFRDRRDVDPKIMAAYETWKEKR